MSEIADLMKRQQAEIEALKKQNAALEKLLQDPIKKQSILSNALAEVAASLFRASGFINEAERHIITARREVAAIDRKE